jgi:hypothetical protein
VEMQRTDKEPVYSIQTSNQNFGWLLVSEYEVLKLEILKL